MKILRTIYRGFGQSYKYADAGQTVTLIADHGNVLIVQDISGKKFPVMQEDVSEDLNAPIIETIVLAPETIITSIKKKPKIINTNQLF